MKILGISGSLSFESNHDCAAALIIDGKLVGNYEEERFNRIKHSVHEFPIISIKKLLDENNLTIDDIDAIGMPNKISYLYNDSYAEEIVKYIDKNAKHIPKLIYKDHHYGHICDSFYQSGFKSAAGIVIDGTGDCVIGITLYHITDSDIKIVKRYDYTKSLGELYNSASSGYCDFGMFGDGKFMGLSSYGIPNQPKIFRWNNEYKEIETLYENVLDANDHQSNMYNFVAYYQQHNYPFERNDFKEEDIDFSSPVDIMYYANFAATIQENFNEIYLELAKYVKEETKEDNLILSGGCVQNCIGNNVVVESGLFKNIFAAPAPHDAGCAAGYAFYAAKEMGENIINTRLTNSYVGKTYTDKEIEDSFDDTLEVKDYNEDDIIEDLKNGMVIAWFQGGSELGPRALGHRSIIANPFSKKTLGMINNTIKNRENWRPLAPTVPAELFDMIFDTNRYDLTEFMLRTIPIKEEWRPKLKAVCHVDGTTRPQRLERKENPELYDLIMKFYKKTGIPCLVNTSFNGKGQPIIEKPEEAIEFLKKTPTLKSVIFNTKYKVSKK